MKIVLKYDNLLESKKQITKELYVADKHENLLKNIMKRFNGEGLTIVPILVESQYPDGSKETVTIMLSSLCEKHNRTINKIDDVHCNTTVYNQLLGIQSNESSNTHLALGYYSNFKFYNKVLTPAEKLNLFLYNNNNIAP